MKKTLSQSNCWANTEQEYLLKSGLYEGNLAISCWQSWCALKAKEFDDIDYVSYTLLPLLSRNLTQYSYQDPLLEKCKGVYRRTWSSNQILWRKIVPVLEQLQAEGIDKIVLLKGMAMIAQYYKDFGVRVIGDVDILIPEEKVALAVEILHNAGWQSNVPRFDPKILNWHAADFKLDEQTKLDLHWSYMAESFKYLDNLILRDAEPLSMNGLKLYIPNPTHLLLQTCIHGVKTSPVPLIRWISDAVTILKNSQASVDWDQLVNLATEMKVCTVLKAGLSYLNERFACTVPETVLSSLKDIRPNRLERIENWSKEHNFAIGKTWTRYCIKYGYTTIMSQVIHFPHYLQEVCRMRSRWHLPFYILLWPPRRFYRFIRKFQGQ